MVGLMKLNPPWPETHAAWKPVHDAFVAWLESSGAVILEPTNPYEVLRYKKQVKPMGRMATLETAVLYVKGNGTLTWTGGSAYSPLRGDFAKFWERRHQPTASTLDGVAPEIAEKVKADAHAEMQKPRPQPKLKAPPIKTAVVTTKLTPDPELVAELKDALGSVKPAKKQGIVAPYTPPEKGTQKNGAKVSALTKAQVFVRDKFECWACGGWCDETGPNPATLEHLLSRVHGGSNDPSNLTCAHADCNALLGSLPLIEKLKLRDEIRAWMELWCPPWQDFDAIEFLARRQEKRPQAASHGEPDEEGAAAPTTAPTPAAPAPDGLDSL